MSEEPISSYRSGRGPKDRNPNSYQTGAQIVKPGPLPRSYTSGMGAIAKGQFVYAKTGTSLSFYEDSKGQKVVGPSGGKGGQSGNPSRSNGEYVGTTTGLADGALIQVEWVNTWWQNPSLQKGSGWNPVAAINSIVGVVKGGERKSEVKVSWVKVDNVDLKKEFTQPAGDLSGDTPYIPSPSGDGSGSGLDTSTLGYAAIATALVVSMKKKKKRR